MNKYNLRIDTLKETELQRVYCYPIYLRDFIYIQTNDS